MPEDKDQNIDPPGLEVELRTDNAVMADARSLGLGVTLRNVGAIPLRVNTLLFNYGSAVLRLRDASGEPVPMIPPSVPPLDDGESGRVILNPGETKHFQYDCGRLLGAPLARGNYAVRFKLSLTSGPSGRDWAGDLESGWVPFQVAGDLVH